MVQSSLDQTPIAVLGQRLQAGLQPQVLVPSLSAGLVTGLIAVIRAISYASLIFSGAIAVHLPIGLGMCVFSTAVSIGLVALTSALPGIIATPLAAPTTILAILAAGVAQELSEAPSTDVLATVLVAIALSTLITGALLLGLGWFRQGERIRFVPYPVIGGFMAGTGWLLTKGFWQITTDQALNVNALATLAQPEMVLRWLPGLGFAIALRVSTRLWQQFWVLPAVLAGSAVSFFGGLYLAGISVSEARAAGWLLGPFPDGQQLWQPLSLELIQQVHWAAIAHQTGNVLTVVFVSVLSLLLSNSSIELITGRDLNLSREMKAIGVANLASGLGGGMVGNQALPSTLLVHNLAANYRLTGMIAVLPAIAVLAFGSAFLSYLPKAVLGSLILYLGLSLLWQWLYQAYFKLPLSDYLTVWLTVVVIDAVGFLQGIVVGFVLTVVLFMLRYSQVDVAKQVSSGVTSRSNSINRTAAEQALLAAQGSQIYVLELQGFLFFGTANYLLNKVRDRAYAPPPSSPSSSLNPEPVKYVVIDFRQVSGLDSSAVLTFNKILKLARQCDFQLVLTNLKPEFAAALERGQGLELEGDRCHVYPDLDRGLESCESHLLMAAQPIPESTPSLKTHLQKQFLTPEQVDPFWAYLVPQSLPANHSLFAQDESSPHLYFIESGQVDVLLAMADGGTKRLQTCSSGQLLGEMRFYGKVPLSTSVVTTTPCTMYALSKTAFEQMQQDAPELAQALQSHIVEILCESLVRRGEQLRVMQ